MLAWPTTYQMIQKCWQGYKVKSIQVLNLRLDIQTKTQLLWAGKFKGKTLLGIVKKLLKTKNNHVMQNWRVQKVKQNVFDLPSGMVKVLRILKTWMDYCVLRSGKNL